MKKLYLLVFCFGLQLSCTHQVHEQRRGRDLASVSTPVGCHAVVEPLIQSDIGPKVYRMTDFPELALDSAQFDDALLKVIRLNREPAMQEQSRIIFGLLKKMHPEEESAELIARYQRHFTDCH